MLVGVVEGHGTPDVSLFFALTLRRVYRPGHVSSATVAAAANVPLAAFGLAQQVHQTTVGLHRILWLVGGRIVNQASTCNKVK